MGNDNNCVCKRRKTTEDYAKVHIYGGKNGKQHQQVPSNYQELFPFASDQQTIDFNVSEKNFAEMDRLSSFWCTRCLTHLFNVI